MGQVDGRGREPRRERRVYGFVEAATDPDETSGLARKDIVLDAVDAESFDVGAAEDRAAEHLAIVRILTTTNRLSELFGVGPELVEGSWCQVQLGPKPGNPPAWILDAAADYIGPAIRTNVIDLQPIGSPPYSTTLPLKLDAWCAIESNPSISDRVYVTSPPPSPLSLHIRMVDVGHANCAAIHVERNADSRIIGYYDVGAPVFFHHRTFPKAFFEQGRVPDDGFVILSHWDFDHYALAVTRLKALQELQWYAPNQSVGPNAARLRAQLGDRLHFIDAKQVPILSNLRLWKGRGPTSDRNNSGYVLRATGPRKSALLTGDVSYEAITSAAKSGLEALGITHHGGNGSANPPRPQGKGRAIVSYGSPNRYGHPSELHLRTHEAAGWKVRRTGGDALFARGDVWLF
jgi:beta-lactamase superfamily II metal-dependent hydrolase